MTTNQDGPSADDFAMKVWREARDEWDRRYKSACDEGCVYVHREPLDKAASQRLSEAFDKVRAEGVEQGRAEERARVVAWLRKSPIIWEADANDQLADALEQGAHDNG